MQAFESLYAPTSSSDSPSAARTNVSAVQVRVNVVDGVGMIVQLWVPLKVAVLPETA